MSEDSAEGDQGGVGPAPLAFIVGLLMPLFFNSFVHGQGAVVYFLVLVALGGAILYGESFLTMPNGVALGIGIVMASSAALDWWLAGLGTVAAALALARYAYADQILTQLERQDLPPQPTTR